MNLITKTAIAAAALCLAASCAQTSFFQNEAYTWQNDTISLNDGSIKAYAPDAHTIISDYPESEFPDGVWKLTRDISHLPTYSAPTRLEEALYNLALEEVSIAVEPDSTLRTGKEWSGVWTRDISYSILLGVSHLQTQASINSLVRKVDALGRIIQDTGTGGSWPCSTDRNIWAVAAWEIYKVTGDKKWLEYIYPIIKRSLEDDILVSLDHHTGLLRGESSYLDWREQEYPRWMTPVDIYTSENLGTECVHYRAFSILAELETMFGTAEDAARYNAIAEGIREGVNKYLWMQDKGYYAQFLYGRSNLSASPRSETLGEALAILWGVASEHQAASICSSVPCQDYGTSCFFPNIADMSPYHNDAMWPFVQAYWMNACKKAGNSAGVMHSIAAISRLAAFCLTNKENMVIYDGRWQGTAINSSRQLWSIAGNLGIVYTVLFGIDFQPEGLHFAPFVPKEMAGVRRLEGFRYRGAIYDITLEGYGDGIRSFTIDGAEAEPFLDASAYGRHQVRIVLNGHLKKSSVNMTANAYSPLTPIARLQSSTASASACTDGSASACTDGSSSASTASESASRSQSLGESDGSASACTSASSASTSLSSESASRSQSLGGPDGNSSASLVWDAVENAVSYKVLCNGVEVASVQGCADGTASCSFDLTSDGEYQVIAVGENGYESFASEPVSYFRTTILTDIVSGKMESAPYSGYLGSGYVDLALDRNTDVSFTASVPEDGRYLIDFIYGNANGPINTENKCAIRTLYVDGQRLGPVVMPHCGTGAFDTWRLTNPLEADLTAGEHTFRLVYQPENCNMNILTNSAALDQLRLRRR